MFRKTILSFGCLFLLGTVWAQGQMILTPKYHAFGQVRPGKHYTFKIKVQNTYAKPVTLASLKTDCDCTSAKLSQTILKPKAFAWLNLDYHPGPEDQGFKSLVVRFNVYYMNDKGERALEVQNLPFTAQIQAYYTFDPPVLSAPFLAYGKQGKAESKLKVDLTAYPHWQFSKVEADGNTPPAVKVAPLSTPGAFTVSIDVDGSWAPGRYQGKVAVEGEDKKGPTKFECPYDINITSAWLTEPRVLKIGVLDPEKLDKWKGHSQIRQIQGKAFKIVKIEGLPDWLKYSVQKTMYGDSLIEWDIDKGKLGDKKEQEKELPQQIDIQTDFTGEPVLHLRLAASWPDGKEKTKAVPSLTPTPARPLATGTPKAQPTAMPKPQPTPTVAVKK